jgi:hypothetical protein
MVKRLIRGALLGGLAAYVWIVFSWTVLPLHGWTLQRFGQEEVVAALLRSQAPDSGVYVLPHPAGRDGDLTQTRRDFLERGPSAFIAVRTSGPGNPSSPWPYVGSLLVHLLVAAGLTALLGLLKPMPFVQQGIVASATATVGGFLVYWPHWLWWGFPFGYCFVNLLDLAIAWFLAGLMIGRFVPAAEAE